MGRLELYVNYTNLVADVTPNLTFQLQGFFLVADDMMDGSTTRRGQPCWYKRDDVGMTAINDAIILETCLYTLLHDHFSDQPNYLDTIDAFLYVGIQFLYSLYDQK